MEDLSNIAHWKQFERLCADLLEAHGFVIESEASVDRTGIDFVASYEYRAHDSSIPPVWIRWFVQCKHYARSRTNLGRKEVAEMLVNYDATRKPGDGLMIMTSSDYTEEAWNKVNDFLSARPGSSVTIWNGRRVLGALHRYPHIAERYSVFRLRGGSSQDHPATATQRAKTSGVTRSQELTSIFRGMTSRPVLFVSDQSVLAHELYRYLKSAGFRVIYLPIWNYNSPPRLDLFLESFQNVEFGLAVVFFGDSFGYPVPTRLENLLVEICRRGGGLLLFPFTAWMIAQGRLSKLARVTPVRLARQNLPWSVSTRIRILTNAFEGNFKSLLVETTFEEDEYREYDTGEQREPLRAASRSRFGISHTFEHLEPVENAKVAWADTRGDPFVVLGSLHGGRTAYLNTCCHSCMAPVALSSPLGNSEEFRELVGNVLVWLLQNQPNDSLSRD